MSVAIATKIISICAFLISMVSLKWSRSIANKQIELQKIQVRSAPKGFEDFDEKLAELILHR